MNASRISKLVGELSALAQDPRLPRRRVRAITQMAGQLARPARVALIGPAGSGQEQVLNALLDGSLMTPDWPTTEVSLGDTPSYRATLPDRRIVEGQGHPGDDILSRSPAFLEIKATGACLADLTLLAVMPHGGVRDLQAAMQWAGNRCDITVWCSARMDEAELALWRSAPPKLTNHAFLAITGEAQHTAPASDFIAAYSVSSEAGFLALQTALYDLVAEARLEDEAAATLLLREGQAVLAAAEPSPRAVTSEPVTGAAQGDEAVIAFPAPAPTPVSTRDPAQDALLSRLLLRVRRDARALLEITREAPVGADVFDEVLGRAEATFEALQEMIRNDEAECPQALASAAEEAAEMALLLRYEGGAGPAGSVAALLMQMRQDIENEMEIAA